MFGGLLRWKMAKAGEDRYDESQVCGGPFVWMGRREARWVNKSQ